MLSVSVKVLTAPAVIGASRLSVPRSVRLQGLGWRWCWGRPDWGRWIGRIERCRGRYSPGCTEMYTSGVGGDHREYRVVSYLALEVSLLQL